jgi:oxygen-independent coproporphyrinogen-3 oxidase
MLGLRLREGISLPALEVRYGIDAAARYAAEIRRFEAEGLLEQDGERLRLTHRGLLVGDTVCAEFLVRPT